MLSSLSFKPERSPSKLPFSLGLPQKPAPLLRPDLLPIPVLQLTTEGLRVLSANPAAQTFFGTEATTSAGSCAAASSQMSWFGC